MDTTGRSVSGIVEELVDEHLKACTDIDGRSKQHEREEVHHVPPYCGGRRGVVDKDFSAATFPRSGEKEQSNDRKKDDVIA